MKTLDIASMVSYIVSGGSLKNLTAMRNILIIIFCFFAFNSRAQNYDSSRNLNTDSLSINYQNLNTVYDIQRNSVYIELGGKGIFGSVNYDRLIPTGDKSGIVLGLALGFLLDVVPSMNYLYGNSKNFLEVGLGYSFPEDLVLPLIGYRYQGPTGFLFRISGMYFQPVQSDSFGDFPSLGLSFGYSF